MTTPAIETEIRAAIRAVRTARKHLRLAYFAAERHTPLEDRTGNLRHDAHALQDALTNTLKMMRGDE